MAKNGKDVLSIEARRAERKDYTKRPDYVAYVSIRAADVMSVADLPVDNPDAGIGKDEPLKINWGCMVQIRQVPQPQRVAVMREDFLEQVAKAESDGVAFVTFVHVDPNMKRSI